MASPVVRSGFGAPGVPYRDDILGQRTIAPGGLITGVKIISKVKKALRL
jgi:hypothetical protein